MRLRVNTSSARVERQRFGPRPHRLTPRRLTCPSHVVLGNVGTSLGSPLVMLLDAIGDGKKGHDPVTLKAVRSTRVLRDLYEESERLDDFGPVLRERCPQLKMGLKQKLY